MKRILLLIILAGSLLGQDLPQITFRTAPPPDIPSNTVSLTVTGTKGSAKYYYWMFVQYPIGASSMTGPIFISNAPDTLDSSNYVVVTWNAIAGASTYDVLRTTTNTFPQGSCVCLVQSGISSTSINDQGAALSSYTLPNPVGTAQAILALNNRDFSAPRMTLDTPFDGTSIYNDWIVIPSYNYKSILPTTISMKTIFDSLSIYSSYFATDGTCGPNPSCTDSTTGLQQGINQLGVTAGRFYILPGNYTCTSLTWGSGPSGQIILMKGASLSCALPTATMTQTITDDNTVTINPFTTVPGFATYADAAGHITVIGYNGASNGVIGGASPFGITPVSRAFYGEDAPTGALNTAGGTTVLATGRGTGSATPASLIIQTGAAGASGITYQARNNAFSFGANFTSLRATQSLGGAATPFQYVFFYGDGSYGANNAKLTTNNTAARTYTFPDETGTVALTNSATFGAACNTTVATTSGTTTFLIPGSTQNSFSCSAGTTGIGNPMPQACTASNLFATNSSSAGNATITLYKGLVAQALTCTMSSATSCSDITHTVAYSQGNTWLVAVTPNANTDPTTQIRVSFQCN